MEERAGEVFSDLTRRAISISSSEGLSSPGIMPRMYIYIVQDCKLPICVRTGGGVVDLTNDSGVEDELVDLTTSPVSDSSFIGVCFV